MHKCQPNITPCKLRDRYRLQRIPVVAEISVFWIQPPRRYLRKRCPLDELLQYATPRNVSVHFTSAPVAFTIVPFSICPWLPMPLHPPREPVPLPHVLLLLLSIHGFSATAPSATVSLSMPCAIYPFSIFSFHMCTITHLLTSPSQSEKGEWETPCVIPPGTVRFCLCPLCPCPICLFPLISRISPLYTCPLFVSIPTAPVPIHTCLMCPSHLAVHVLCPCVMYSLLPICTCSLCPSAPVNSLPYPIYSCLPLHLSSSAPIQRCTCPSVPISLCSFIIYPTLYPLPL